MSHYLKFWADKLAFQNDKRIKRHTVPDVSTNRAAIPLPEKRSCNRNLICKEMLPVRDKTQAGHRFTEFC
jgi:hypothetical protein